MITVIIGHRGTGKSDLVKRLRFYVGTENAGFLDLDQEIEEKSGKVIRELFLENGEAYFREMERQVFLENTQSPTKDLYIVVGAGFDVATIPPHHRVLWVRRETDLDGRIFLDRPRLDPQISPLQEFIERARPRQLAFKNRADEVYLMPEGIFENRHQAMEMEKKILLHNLESIQGSLTILPDVLQSPQRWQGFLDRFKDRGITFFEVRDDYLSDEAIDQVLGDLQGENIVYSLRRSGSDEFLESPRFAEILNQVSYIDYAWELGRAESASQFIPQEKLILSLHEAKFFSSWLLLEDQSCLMKFAPEVFDFQTLQGFHRWQQQKPLSRSFLPRSSDGRWEWYRLRQKGHQFINFFKEDSGSSEDQPSLWSWMMTPLSTTHFAAVLGDPVRHSYTPLEHSDFFAKREIPVFKIRVPRDEWDQAFSVLEDLGLTHAAVTAPHKENAAKKVSQTSLKALNTLARTSTGWVGTSTDDQGFAEMIEGIGMIAPRQKEIFIWGGGGVLSVIEKELPHGIYFSSREGLPRNAKSDEIVAHPKIIVWAAPRSDETKWPPLGWKPQMVVDLNYKEDSMGREYAQRCGANYISGLVMFKTQAQGQRAFWQKLEEQ